MDDERTGTVWSATWVPSASPYPGYGDEGYAVCWVDLDGGDRVQVLAVGPRPEPGATGQMSTLTLDEISLEVFEESGS